jgi:hypothetical protein
MLQKQKITKKTQNKNKGFSYYFCLMMELLEQDPELVPYLGLTYPDPGGPKTYPEHWLKE